MPRRSRVCGVAVSWLILTSLATAADPPSIEKALEPKPSQKDVEYETPPANKLSQCKVELETRGKAVGWVVLGPEGQAFARASASQLLGPVNGLLRAIYEGSGVAVADIERAFSSNDFDTLVDLPGAGAVPLNVARICMWTWVCAPAPLGPDNHANADGYAVIARAYADELGL